MVAPILLARRRQISAARRAVMCSNTTMRRSGNCFLVSWLHHPLDEHRLAVEYVDPLSVTLQRTSSGRPCFSISAMRARRAFAEQIGTTGIGWWWRRPVQLDRAQSRDGTGLWRFPPGRRVVGGEVTAPLSGSNYGLARQRSRDAPAIGAGLLHRGHRRFQEGAMMAVELAAVSLITSAIAATAAHMQTPVAGEGMISR